MQLAHKFNVKTALDHCDVYLAKRAGEDEDFLQMGTVGLMNFLSDKVSPQAFALLCKGLSQII